MKGKVDTYIESYLYGLPALSGFLLIFSLPPFSFTPLVFIALVPLYIFIYKISTYKAALLGGGLFALIFVGYVVLSMSNSFIWFSDSGIFLTFIKLIVALAIASVATIISLWMVALVKLKSLGNTSLWRILFFSSYTFIEYGLQIVFLDYNFLSVAYAAIPNEFMHVVVSLGGSALLTFVALLVNAILAEAVILFLNEKYTYAYVCIGIIIVFSLPLFLYQTFFTTEYPVKSYLSVALIQDQDRSPDSVFGSVTNGVFTAPVLEEYVQETNGSQPDVIVYPFSPWFGLLSEDFIDNTSTVRGQIVMTDTIFSQWVQKNIPEDVVFVTWYTTYRAGQYFNEIVYWQNGELIGLDRKRELFPFFDYNPAWAEKIGITSLPYNATPGTLSTSGTTIGSIRVGSLVCSEVTNEHIAKENAVYADVIFAIGSEAMFNNEIASEYNHLNAQLRASEIHVPVIRSNKFGPSAVFDATGKLIAYMPHRESGVLYVEVPVPEERKVTIYEKVGEYFFITLFSSFFALCIVGRITVLVIRKKFIISSR
ncbi:MAG: apolipoprotein N-acyltransferase [Acidimicrobiales bacterium]|jgi:apolipoprotein N-acyltransferase